MRPTRATAWRFLKDRSIAVLSTVSDDGPRTTPIFYKLTERKTLCFVTGNKTSKYKDMMNDNRIALSVVDPNEPIAVNIYGKAEFVTDPQNELEIFRLVGGIKSDFDHPSTKHGKGRFMAVEISLGRIQYTDYSERMDSKGIYIFDL